MMNYSTQYKTIAIVMILLFPLKIRGQVLDSVSKRFSNYHEHVLQEKIFVHADQTFYLAGEKIWFKLYTVDATLNTPLNVSKIAYVDVLDKDNNAVMQAKIALTNGIGTGLFSIPLTVSSGNYRLRAYTSWMKNFSPELYFNGAISIYNALSPAGEEKVLSDTSYDIQFFPEGGHMVNGLNSTVAFKVTGADGKGANVTGFILNQNNDTVARFKSFQFGMGHFVFTPQTNTGYKAVLKIEKGRPIIKNLPVADQNGYVIHLTDELPGQLTLTVNTNTAESKNDSVYVFVHTGQVMKLAKWATLCNGTSTIPIDKTILGDGISHITLFNNRRQTVCERLYFKQPKQLVVEASADSQAYHLRKKVNVAINAKSSDGKPLSAGMSLSVYRVDSLTNQPAASIASYLWLASELKGSIESPDYYLNTKSKESAEAVDNLMMTQGWRRFDWRELMSDKKPVFQFIPEFDGHIITAKVSQKTSAKPMVNSTAYLGVISKRAQLYVAQSDFSGRLLFDTRKLYGSNDMVLQFADKRDSTNTTTILSPFSETYSETLLSQASAVYNKLSVDRRKLDMQLQNIFAAGNVGNNNPLKIDSSAFYGKTKTYLLDDFTRFTTMEEVLREYVQEVNLIRQKKRLNIKVINGKDYLADEPLLLLDGVPVFDRQKILLFDPIKVKKLEVVAQTYHVGAATMEGILNFTTYHGDLGGFDLDPRSIVFDYQGLQEQASFYSPVYETDKQKNVRTPDFRSLLYWSSNLHTDVNGNVQTFFFTSDEPGKYIGVINGLTDTGEAGSRYFTFDVKNHK